MYFTAKPRCEIRLYRALCEQNVVSYLPMIKKTTEYSHRIYTRMVSMFPGYVFASTCRMGFDISKLDKYLGRCYFLDDRMSADLLRDLISIRKYELLAQNHKVEVLLNVSVGDSVLITHGYFEGERAIIERIDEGHERVVVALTSLPMGISVELPTDFLT